MPVTRWTSRENSWAANRNKIFSLQCRPSLRDGTFLRGAKDDIPATILSQTTLATDEDVHRTISSDTKWGMKQCENCDQSKFGSSPVSS